MFGVLIDNIAPGYVTSLYVSPYLFLDPEVENDLRETIEENEECEETNGQTDRKVETKTGSGNEISQLKDRKDSLSDNPVSKIDTNVKILLS